MGLVDPLPFKGTCDLGAKEKQLSGPSVRVLTVGAGVLYVTVLFEHWDGVEVAVGLGKPLVVMGL